MKILRRVPITIAVISAMVTVASSQVTLATNHLTTLEATPHKLVLGLSSSISQAGNIFEEAGRLAAEHCKKFGKVASLPDLLSQPGPPSIVLTFKCVG